MRMSEQARKAVEGSIAHWKRLLEARSKNAIRKEGFKSKSCPLCDVFIDRVDLDSTELYCDGCPIRKVTGRVLCRGTPYADASNNLHAYLHKSGAKLKRAPLNKEYEFLKSLLTLTPKQIRKKFAIERIRDIW